MDKTVCCCGTRYALIVAGIIFGIVALVHLYRIFYFFPVVIGAWAVPAGFSIVFFIVFGLLSFWMFWASKDSTKCAS